MHYLAFILQDVKRL